MAALFGVTSPRPAPAGPGGPAGTAADPAGMVAALAYVERCLRGHRSFGILTGGARPLASLVARAAAAFEEREDLHLIRAMTPTDSVQTFLVSCLEQLGFEMFQARPDDLHNLLVVFLRHEGARGRRTVAIIESTEHCGPRVLEFMQTLSKVRAGATPAMTFLLTGSHELHRVLDSPGMAGLRRFTRERFDLDRSLAWVVPDAKPAAVALSPAPSEMPRSAGRVTSDAPGSLVITLGGTILERRILEPGRLVVGRSPGTGLRLDSRFVSRHHAVLSITPDSVSVTDLRSTNGTLVNGVITASQQLEHGDLITIGNFRLRYNGRPRSQT